MKKLQMFRQGDVLLRQVREIPADAVVTEKKDQFGNERIVLAYGEVTGHAHAIHDLDQVDVFVKGDGTMYLQVKDAVDLKHEEHGTVLLPAGNYERVIQREYSPEEIRNVAD
jgi:mannose-6-phosphate isomerase-like protein (cupin superfamily)